MRPRSLRQLEELLELVVLGPGHFSVRAAHMEHEKRYRIDVSDRLHPVIFLNADLPIPVVAQAYPEALARLCEWAKVQRRRSLEPVEELAEHEDAFVVDLAPTADGTGGGSEIVADALRASFRVVSGTLSD